MVKIHLQANNRLHGIRCNHNQLRSRANKTDDIKRVTCLVCVAHHYGVTMDKAREMLKGS